MLALITGVLCLVFYVSDLIGTENANKFEKWLHDKCKASVTEYRQHLANRKMNRQVRSMLPIVVVFVALLCVPIYLTFTEMSFGRGLLVTLACMLYYYNFMSQGFDATNQYFLPLVLYPTLVVITAPFLILHKVAALTGQSSYFNVGKYLVRAILFAAFVYSLYAMNDK